MSINCRAVTSGSPYPAPSDGVDRECLLALVRNVFVQAARDADYGGIGTRYYALHWLNDPVTRELADAAGVPLPKGPITSIRRRTGTLRYRPNAKDLRT